MITTGFYTALARLHQGDLDARVTTIGFGSSNAAETETDTALSDAYTRPIDGVEALDRVLRFRWSLGRDEAVGLEIREIDLFTEDGVLVARQARAGAISKAADMELGDTFDLQL
jgi:hypothetical protein